MRENAREYLRANDEAKKLKEEQRRLEALVDAQITTFAAEKERMQAIRKQHEAEKFKQRQDRYDELISRQRQHLAAVKAEEEARLQRDMDAMNRKTEERIKQEVDHRARLLHDLKRGRELQMLRQAQDLALQAERDRLMHEEWKKTDARLAAHEADLERRERENNKTLQTSLRQQATEHQQRLQQTRVQELLDAERTKRTNAVDEAVFHAYVDHHLQDYELKGRPTLPIKIALHQQTMRAKHLTL